MPAPEVTVPDVDTSVIPYTAELEAPALRQTAPRFLMSEARRPGVPLDPAEVLVRRASSGTQIHIMAAACELVAHPATGPTRSARTARSWSRSVPERWH